ncbi:Acetyltransferase OS=Streptomyces glaucescens OX=1907 GN=SGLAU_10760 PE=4 SV=1 [Streptomyces glaucescens]
MPVRRGAPAVEQAGGGERESARREGGDRRTDPDELERDDRGAGAERAAVDRRRHGRLLRRARDRGGAPGRHGAAYGRTGSRTAAVAELTPGVPAAGPAGQGRRRPPGRPPPRTPPARGGASGLVLDTRGDLVEARTLYARLGYEETAPHNDEPYAEHWFAKNLG